MISEEPLLFRQIPTPCLERGIANVADESPWPVRINHVLPPENAAVGNGHLEKGMHVIAKPFEMDRLAHTIREMIKE
jgi:hypothetical protein